jgi:hypothetical protein
MSSIATAIVVPIEFDEMRKALVRADLCVPEQFSNDRQAKAAASALLRSLRQPLSMASKSISVLPMCFPAKFTWCATPRRKRSKLLN